VKHFRHMLEARHFLVFTDHKPITYVFQHKRDKCSSQQFSHLDFIAKFTLSPTLSLVSNLSLPVPDITADRHHRPGTPVLVTPWPNCVEFNFSRQPPTISQPMDLWNASTGRHHVLHRPTVDHFQPLGQRNPSHITTGPVPFPKFDSVCGGTAFRPIHVSYTSN
jgi:hypothetical protein